MSPQPAPSGLSEGQKMPYSLGCSCRGVEFLPSRLMGVLMRRRCESAACALMRERICTTPVLTVFDWTLQLPVAKWYASCEVILRKLMWSVISHCLPESTNFSSDALKLLRWLRKSWRKSTASSGPGPSSRLFALWSRSSARSCPRETLTSRRTHMPRKAAFLRHTRGVSRMPQCGSTSLRKMCCTERSFFSAVRSLTPSSPIHRSTSSRSIANMAWSSTAPSISSFTSARSPRSSSTSRTPAASRPSARTKAASGTSSGVEPRMMKGISTKSSGGRVGVMKILSVEVERHFVSWHERTSASKARLGPRPGHTYGLFVRSLLWLTRTFSFPFTMK